MYERILVALDGSAVAEKALAHAIGPAENHGSMITLLTVAHDQASLAALAPSLAQAAISQDVIARTESAREQSADRQYLEDVRARIAAKGLDVETRVREGKPAEQILRLASELHAGVIVLTAYGGGGAHTRSGSNVFGGVTDEVLRESHTPVLLIRP